MVNASTRMEDICISPLISCYTLQLHTSFPVMITEISSLFPRCFFFLPFKEWLFCRRLQQATAYDEIRNMEWKSRLHTDKIPQGKCMSTVKYSHQILLNWVLQIFFTLPQQHELEVFLKANVFLD